MFGLDIIGGLIKPKMNAPAFTSVDAQAEQQKAIAGNIASLPSIEDLASKYSDFANTDLLKQMNKLIPGYSDIMSKEGEQIKSLLSGELPKDVTDTITRHASELGITTGASQSDFEKFGALREMGLTSLQAISQGFDAASRWIAQAAKPVQFDFSSMFLTPQQQIGLDVEERNAKFQRDWTQNLLDYQQNPMTIIGDSLIKTDAQLAQIAASVAGKAAGAAFA